MNYLEIKNQLESYIAHAKSQIEKINLYIIASIKEITQHKLDYSKHSVTTSYLSRQTLDELVASFRKYSNYLQVYTDIETFLKDFYSQNLRVLPTLIFETSPKGIGRGKDALIPALCDILDIPHLGPPATANVICTSKFQWTSILKANNILTPKSYLFQNNQWINEPSINKKIILKLNYECSSIGLSNDSVMINNGENALKKAEQLFKDYKQPVIAQDFIEGYEVEVPVLINRNFKIVLPPVGLCASDKKLFTTEYFDYDTIYTDDYNTYDFREVNEQLSEKIMSSAYRIIDILDLSGYMRLDFRVDTNGNFFVFDINNDPCISSSGSYFKSIDILGIDTKEIAGILIGNALINDSKVEYH